jgi:hypothetical protein
MSVGGGYGGVPYEQTLDYALKHRWRAVMRCAQGKRRGMKSIRVCMFNCELEILTLVCTRGGAFPMDLLASRLRCPECRSPNVSLMFIPPAGSDTVRGVAAAE